MRGRDNDRSLPGAQFCGHGWGVSVPCVSNVVVGTFLLEPSRLKERKPSPFLLVKVTACVLTKFVKLEAIGKLNFGGDCPFVFTQDG